MLNPDEFVITRRRKKYKFAKFLNSPLCYEFADWNKSPADCIEVGAGTGLFSVELATRQPDMQFVAMDVKADRLQKGAYEAQARGLTNIRFLRARADQLSECFEEGAAAEVWVTFPDPFPKKRSAGRRLMHPTFLSLYAALLKPEGAVCLKHDNLAFFQWSLEQLVAEKWRIEELSFDLHESDQAEEYKVLTTYEQRWLGEGLVTHFVRASRG